MDLQKMDSLRADIDAIGKGEQHNLYKHLLTLIPTETASAELGAAVAKRPPEERKKAAEKFAASMGGGWQERASPQVRDRLYQTIVRAFSVVMVGSFIALAIGVFWPAGTNNVVKPDTILTTFTTVVGFLAGLFAPSPFSRTEGQEKGGRS